MTDEAPVTYGCCEHCEHAEDDIKPSEHDEPCPDGCNDTARELLELELPENGSGRPTVGGYLAEVLLGIWESRDDYSPFGNSGWAYELYRPMLAAGLAGGLTEAEAARLDEGYGIPAAKETELAALVAAAIHAMGGEGGSGE